MKKLPLFIIALLLAFQSLSTEVLIKGLVTNSLDLSVLRNHKIQLVNLSNPKDTLVSYTNKNGHYYFSVELNNYTEIKLLTEGVDLEKKIIYTKKILVNPEQVTQYHNNFLILYNPITYKLFTISGYVIQKENQKPITNHPVSLYKNINSVKKITIYTDKNGFYNYTYEVPLEENEYAVLETRGNCDNEWTDYRDTIKSYEFDYNKDFLICHDSLWYLQDFIINGYVFDDQTEEPIENHAVYIIQKKSLLYNIEIYTDKNGFFADTLKIDVQNDSEFDIRTFSYCDERQITHYNNSVTAFAGTYYNEFFICQKQDPLLVSCELSFIYYQSKEDLKVYFFDLSEELITNQTWNLGDGTIKYGKNIEHTYSEEGVYDVCLTAETEAGCTAEYCKKIVVGNSFGFEGNVYASGMELPEGIVTFFKYDRKADHYKYINYTQISEGRFNVAEMITGDYLLFAIPIFDVDYNYFPKYLPTYFGQKSSWQNANSMLIDRSSNSIDINLLKYDEIFYGQAAISGNVDLNNHAEKEQITVTLLNSENVPMDFRILDEQNNFNFTELPFGNYKVIVECAGKNSNVCNVFVEESEPESPKINFVVNQTEIDSYAVDINNIVGLEKINIYPNPFFDKININSNSIVSENIEFVIFDISGKQIYSEIIINQSDNRIELKQDFSSLPKGVYFCKIKTDEKIIHSQKLIKI